MGVVVSFLPSTSCLTPFHILHCGKLRLYHPLEAWGGCHKAFVVFETSDQVCKLDIFEVALFWVFSQQETSKASWCKTITIFPFTDLPYLIAPTIRHAPHVRASLAHLSPYPVSAPRTTFVLCGHVFTQVFPHVIFFPFPLSCLCGELLFIP